MVSRQSNNAVPVVKNESDCRTVRMIRTPSMIRVPAMRELGLLTSCKVVTAKPSSHVRLQRKTVPLLELGVDHEGNRCARGPRHLEPLVSQLFHAQGVRVEIDGQKLVEWQPHHNVDRLVCPDANALMTIGSAERMLLSCSTAIDSDMLMAQIPLVYPTKDILFVTKSERAGRRLAHRLKSFGIKVTTFFGNRHDEVPVTPVAVGTFLGVSHPAARLENRDLVVMADARDALEKRGEFALELAGQHRAGSRLIGLIQNDDKIPPTDAGRLLETYGPIETRITAHGLVARRVAFAFIRCGGTQLAKGLRPVDIMRRGIWGNKQRNRLTAKVAKAVINKDADTLRQLNPNLSSACTTVPKSRLLVVVANEEHAQSLMPFLDRTGAEFRRISPVFGTPDGSVVCTSADLPRVPVGDFDVVIRADGGAGALAHGVYINSRDLSAPELLLIDIDDGFDAGLGKRFRERRASYRSAGWRSVTEPEGLEELNLHFGRHPDGARYRRLLDRVKTTIPNSMRSSKWSSSTPSQSIVETYPRPFLEPVTDSSVDQIVSPSWGIGGYSCARRRHQASVDKFAIATGKPEYLPSLEQIVAPDNLYAVLHGLISGGAGTAAGPDGLGLLAGCRKTRIIRRLPPFGGPSCLRVGLVGFLPNPHHLAIPQPTTGAKLRSRSRLNAAADTSNN